MFTEQAGGLMLPTKGHVTVDLVDAHSGRVMQREEADNFLSLQSLKVAKWWQRAMWGMYNPIYTADTAGNKPHEMPWFPSTHLAYWNDATAEAPSTEDFVAKELVGWASRHPVGSPSGRRGVVNVSESAVTDAAAKWVFDWATSQGNGTFQSVGWTRLQETTQFPVARFPEDDGVSFINGSAGTGITSGNPIYWDPTANLWYFSEYTNVGGAYRIASAPAAGGASTAVVTLPTSIVSTHYMMGLARIGTDFIIVAGNPTAKLARMTAAGAVTWNVSTPGGATQLTDCTVDGSGNIWTCDVAGVVRRHSNADGSVTATVNPTIAPTLLTGIAYDPADSNFWLIGTVSGINKQMWKIDNSGNTVGPLFSLYDSASAITSSAPYVGAYYVPGSGARDPYNVKWGIGSGSSISGLDFGPGVTRGSASVLGVSGYYPLAMKDSFPWVAGRISFTIFGADRATPVRGGTLGTRSKLTSAVTKTSSQTLKVTYQFNFS